MLKIRIPLIGVVLLCCLLARADEGMFPINTIGKAGLKKAGLKMDVNDIYNPNGHGLIQAVVQIGGCTGSFVSDKGLIITNHHCAFGGLEPYSKPGNNLMENGYLAVNQSKELPIKGLTCRILISHQDVSEQVLKGVSAVNDAIKKKELIAANIQSVKKLENLKNPDLMLDVAEMLPGKSYMLFRYFLIKDLRIVYIPARNIGEFGGDSDNWEWPRHTGDFSFVRAYVSKNGKSSGYDTANVAYHPQEYLNINQNGVKENDFLFVVGYPGRTFRHQPAEFIKYQENYTLPYVADLYAWEINNIKRLGKNDESFMLKNEPKIKQLANVMKNYQGKLQTVRTIDLYNSKKKQEENILGKLDGPGRNKFHDILQKYDDTYTTLEKTSYKYMWYTNLLSESKAMNIVQNLSVFSQKYLRTEPDEMQKLKLAYIKLLRDDYKEVYLKYDSVFVRKMFLDARSFADNNRIEAVEELERRSPDELNRWIHKAYGKNKIYDSIYIFNLILQKPQKIAKISDPLTKFFKAIASDYASVDSIQNACRAQLDALLPDYVDLRMQAIGESFIPDANRTLRLTYGYIRGYNPRDATRCSPFTTAKGMAEKNGGAQDYVANLDIVDLLKRNNFGVFKLKDQDDLPLCMLYNTDTTGGNSGSPVLNDNGELVGLNFDRCYEATVNDYAWDESYSRSIGVDIRFVLWVTSKVANGNYLLDEMHIEK